MQQRRHTAQQDSTHDMMRCVIDAQGMLLFAGPALG